MNGAIAGDERDARTIEGGGEVIDLRSMWLILRRRIRVFLLVAILIALGPLAYAVLAPAGYTSTSNILIDRRTTDVTDSAAVLSGLPQDSASVDTEVQVLQSPALARRVVRKLGLVTDPEFNYDLSDNVLLKSWNWFTSLFATDSGLNKAQKTEQKVIGNLLDDVSVNRQGLTYVISLAVTTEDSKKSARIAGTFVHEYLAGQVEEKRKAADEAEKFLNDRIGGLGNKVHQQESDAESLRAQAGIPDAQNGSTFDQQAIQDLSRQAIAIQSDLAEKRGKLAAARAARDNPAALPDVIASNVIRDLKAQRATALSVAADVQTRYGPLHPESIKSKNQIREIDAEISREMSNIIASLSQEVATAEQQLSVVQGHLAQQRNSAVGNSVKAARVSQIEREASADRDIYQDFLKRSKESAQTSALSKPDAVVVDPATPPQKASTPKRLLIIIAGLGIGGAMGLVAVVLAELLDAKLSSGSDIYRYLGLRKLASIPAQIERNSMDRQALLIVERPKSSYTEAYRGLTDHVVRKSSDPSANCQVIMVTSAVPHEGKTTVACSLALSLATTGKRTLLIDADLRRPQVLDALNLSTGSLTGAKVAALVEGQTTSLDGAVVNFGTPSLDVLPLAADGDPWLEMFRDRSFSTLLANLRKLYDIVVIDTPPVLALNDARHMKDDIDVVLFVSRWRKTSRFAATTAVNALREVDAPLAGVVLNGVDVKMQSLYSSDDSLSFYDRHNYYYTE